MKEWLLHIYDFFAVRRHWLWIGFAVVMLPLVILAVSLRYNEDIMDFLPVTEEEREAFDAYRTRQSAAQIVLVIEGGDEEQRNEALYEITDRINSSMPDVSINDPMANDRIVNEFYSRLPSLIPDSTYDRFDSLFTPEAVRAALRRDRLVLSTPGTSLLVPAIRHDPLGLSDMNQRPGTGRVYAFIESPYGATETKRNAALIDSLTFHLSPFTIQFTDLDIRLTGAPVIAVGNARRIKTDTLLCIGLSLVLILALLLYSFPRRRDIWLILLSVSFGWLVGMAALRIYTPTVSAIVLGIGSVLIGIAVNYPLHLLVHQRYTDSVRQTLNEVLTPLVVGNVTTVGAFMALIPLRAQALRELGIFAAAMLVGTILFCVFVLPHLMSAEQTQTTSSHFRPFQTLSNYCQTRSNHFKRFPTIARWVVVGLTVFFGAYLFWGNHSSLFDSDINHINYMTPRQRADMSAFDLPAGDAERWTAYWQNHSADSLIAVIGQEASAAGFRPEAFQPFYDMLRQTTADGKQSSSDVIPLSTVISRLSDDFDYIGLCCSIIVFVFLWLSFRSLRLALIAFIPMALSWVWILALMQLSGLQFNIVNIILATFIFGQGDDYTIFIVEGLLYEYRTGKPMLPQYRQSILLSALVMLVGIGILVLAVHPAMHSLGIVTLIGMTVVLIMAVTIPPLLFRLYKRK